MRGQRAFEKLNNEKKNVIEDKGFKRGRNGTFIKNRNECLFYRYYYYSKIKKLRYEDVLEVVSSEFFICPRTIINVLDNDSGLVKTIFKEKLPIKELEKKFIFLNWHIKEQIKKI